MEGDDERTDKESGRSQQGSPRDSSKTNTNVTDSSSGENGSSHSHHRSKHTKRRRSSRISNVSRHRIKSTNREDLKIGTPRDENPKERATHKRRRRHNKSKHYTPYAKLSWEKRMKMDEMESERATRRRADRPTPYNTTQFLMEDHKAVTPDLSGLAETNDDTSEETFEDFRNGEYLEKNFSEAYDEFQNERLQSMSKEQLVNEVLALSKRVADLEDAQRQLKVELGHEVTDVKEIISTSLDIGLPLNPPALNPDVPHPGKELGKSVILAD